MDTGFDPRRTPGDGASLSDRPAAKYVGVRDATGATVARESDTGRVTPLPLRGDLRRHSGAFEWGYGGSGPAQLALAILADAVGAERAAGCYQRFKFEVIGRLSGDRWELTREDVLAWHRADVTRADPAAGDG